jgi:tetratricopeptide (TPR) repeat protein
MLLCSPAAGLHPILEIDLMKNVRIFAMLAGAMQIAGAQARMQTPADHVALGDKDHAALNYSTALKHYEAALAIDSMYYDALVKGAREAVELGTFDTNEAERTALYKRAEQYARRAVVAKPADAEAHFELAKAIGRNAQTMGTKDKVKFAGVVHDEALTSLKFDPKHPGALHVMGEWNAEVMRLNGISRFMARNLLGGKVFGEASWDNAIRYMEQAVALDPGRITHHLDLARIYMDRDMNAKAKEQLDWIARAPISEYNDKKYKEEAAELAAKIK